MSNLISLNMCCTLNFYCSFALEARQRLTGTLTVTGNNAILTVTKNLPLLISECRVIKHERNHHQTNLFSMAKDFLLFGLKFSNSLTIWHLIFRYCPNYSCLFKWYFCSYVRLINLVANVRLLNLVAIVRLLKLANVRY